jgi:hypothetical protein
MRRFAESFGAFAVAMAIVLLLCALAAYEPPHLATLVGDGGGDMRLAGPCWEAVPSIAASDSAWWYHGEWGQALRGLW